MYISDEEVEALKAIHERIDGVSSDMLIRLERKGLVDDLVEERHLNGTVYVVDLDTKLTPAGLEVIK